MLPQSLVYIAPLLLLCSHQLHSCINPNACQRSAATQQNMTDWAYRHTNYTIRELNYLTSPNSSQPIYMEYMSYMCPTGYSGPLCGACQPGFGHSGNTCEKCHSKAVNALFFIGMCLLTFLIPGVSMFMHIGEVKRRTRKLTDWQKQQQNQGSCAAAAPAAAASPAAAAPAAGTELTEGPRGAAGDNHRGCAAAPTATAAAGAAPLHQQQQQPQQQPISRLRLLQRRLLDISVLDDDLGVDTSSNPATAPTDASRAPTESSVDDGAAGAAACTAAGQVRRRSFKFWHTDVLIVSVCNSFKCTYSTAVVWLHMLDQWLPRCC